MSSVLYDAQGPRAKRRNVVFTAVFVVVVLALLWWVYATLDEKGQLEWAKWQMFFTSDEPWSTYIWPGLQNTLKAAALSMVIALPLGAVLGIARLSDHAWVRIPVAIVVEFFRSIPVLVLMIFGLALFAEYTDVSSTTVRCTRSSRAWCCTTPPSSRRSSGQASSRCPRGRPRERWRSGCARGSRCG